MKNEEKNVLKEVKNYLIVLGFVVLFLGTFYFIATMLIDNESSDDINYESPISIQYDEILVGEILSQEGSYYVLASREEDVYVTLYEEQLSTYEDTNGKVYTVDLDSVFNSKFLAEEANYEFTQLSEITFNETVLLYIEEGSIKEYFETKDAITAELTRIKE